MQYHSLSLALVCVVVLMEHSACKKRIHPLRHLSFRIVFACDYRFSLLHGGMGFCREKVGITDDWRRNVRRNGGDNKGVALRTLDDGESFE